MGRRGDAAAPTIIVPDGAESTSSPRAPQPPPSPGASDRGSFRRRHSHRSSACESFHSEADAGPASPYQVSAVAPRARRMTSSVTSNSKEPPAVSSLTQEERREAAQRRRSLAKPTTNVGVSYEDIADALRVRLPERPTEREKLLQRVRLPPDAARRRRREEKRVQRREERRRRRRARQSFLQEQQAQRKSSRSASSGSNACEYRNDDGDDGSARAAAQEGYSSSRHVNNTSVYAHHAPRPTPMPPQPPASSPANGNDAAALRRGRVQSVSQLTSAAGHPAATAPPALHHAPRRVVNEHRPFFPRIDSGMRFHHGAPRLFPHRVLEWSATPRVDTRRHDHSTSAAAGTDGRSQPQTKATSISAHTMHEQQLRERIRQRKLAQRTEECAVAETKDRAQISKSEDRERQKLCQLHLDGVAAAASAMQKAADRAALRAQRQEAVALAEIDGRRSIEQRAAARWVHLTAELMRHRRAAEEAEEQRKAAAEEAEAQRKAAEEAEAQRKAEEETAAVKIQSAQRRRRAIVKVSELRSERRKSAAIMIQSSFRRHVARAALRRLREERERVEDERRQAAVSDQRAAEAALAVKRVDRTAHLESAVATGDLFTADERRLMSDAERLIDGAVRDLTAQFLAMNRGAIDGTPMEEQKAAYDKAKLQLMMDIVTHRATFQAEASDPARAERLTRLLKPFAELLVRDTDRNRSNVTLLSTLLRDLPAVDWAGIIAAEQLCHDAVIDGSVSYVDTFLGVPLLRLPADECKALIVLALTHPRCRLRFAEVVLRRELPLRLFELRDELRDTWQSFFAACACGPRPEDSDDPDGVAQRVAILSTVAGHHNVQIDFEEELRDGQTIISRMCAENEEALLAALLLRCGSKIEPALTHVSTVDGTTPLIQACAHNNVAVARRLLHYTGVVEQLEHASSSMGTAMDAAMGVDADAALLSLLERSAALSPSPVRFGREESPSSALVGLSSREFGPIVEISPPLGPAVGQSVGHGTGSSYSGSDFGPEPMDSLELGV